MQTNPVRTITILLITAASLVLAITSCDKEGDSFRNEWKKEGAITFLDITNARSLLITGDPGRRKSSSNLKSDEPVSSLFKVTDEGLFQEIKYYRVDTIFIEKEEGMDIELDSVEVTINIYPVAIFDVSEDYLIACFEEVKEGDSGHPYEYNYLARKSDGAVFDLPGNRPTIQKVYWEYGKMFANEDGSHLVQQDAMGNVYYLGYWAVFKLDIQNPENILWQRLTQETHSGEDVAYFSVNGEGHIIFTTGGITTPLLTRFRYNTGRLQYPEKTLSPFWVGFDDKFYHAIRPDYQPGNPGYPIIERIKLENEEATYEHVGTIVHPQADHTRLSGAYMFRLRGANKIVALDLPQDMNQGGKLVAEVYNNDMTVRSFDLSQLGITEVRHGTNSPNYYYLSGMDGNQPVLVKANPSVFPHSYEYLVPRGELDIFNMVVSDDDIITFHALRMSNGRIIIGEISPNGTITELDEIGSEVMSLIRVQ